MAFFNSNSVTQTPIEPMSIDTTINQLSKEEISLLININT